MTYNIRPVKLQRIRIRINIFYSICYSFLLLLTTTSQLLATPFDGDFDIEEINMADENFLDINAYRFRKSIEDQWYDSLNGWRMNGASLNSDFTFLQTEIKLHQALSESVNVRLQAEQEVLYKEKDFPRPTVEVEIYPFNNDLGFAVLGTPGYEKRDIDLGGAIIWGRRPWNYARIELLKVDATYNVKTDFDNTELTEEPLNIKLETAYHFGEKFKSRFRYSLGDDFQLIDRDSNIRFDHVKDDYFLLVDYHPETGKIIGFTINGFNEDKSRLSSNEDRQQKIDFLSVDLYHVTGIQTDYEIRFGLQYDHLQNRIYDAIDLSQDESYDFSTLQAYSNVFHPFSEHMAWDLGLYLGHVEEIRKFTFADERDKTNDGFQGKFRFGFVYRSADGRNTLQLNVSLDIDEFFSATTDGGGISFQSVF